MSPEQQLEHLKRNKEGTLKVVLRFLAGLTKLANIPLDQIKGLFGKPPQSSQRKYCTRMTPDISLGVHHTNWMFETQSTEIIKTLLEKSTVEFVCAKEMVPLEYYCVGYCIAHIWCNWCLTFTEDIEYEKMEMFLTEIKGGTEHRVAVKTGQPMSSEKLNTLFATLGPWLEELYFKLADNGSSLSMTNLSALHILELGMYSSIPFNIFNDFTFQSLESLTINAGNVGITLGLKTGEAIAKFLSSSTSLQELHFNDAHGKTWRMSTKCIEAITKSMSDNMALPLRSLQIECKCALTNIAATSLALFIKNSTSLNYAGMWNISVNGRGLQEVHEAVHNCSSLQEKFEKLRLDVECWEDSTKYTQLWFNDYADKVLELYLPTSDVGATALAQALHHNSTLEKLHLFDNNICDVGATDLAQALHHNSALKELNLVGNNISDAGATALAQALHHNSTLKELNLVGNNISDAGATALARALHHNSTLKELNLSDNNLSDVGATDLAQALHHKIHNPSLMGCSCFAIMP